MSRRRDESGQSSPLGGGEFDDLIADALRSVERHQRQRALRRDEPSADGDETGEHVVVPEELLDPAAGLEVVVAGAAPGSDEGTRASATKAGAELVSARHQVEQARRQVEQAQRQVQDLMERHRKLERNLEEALSRAQQLEEQVLRHGAELETVRRRAAREKRDLELFGTEKLLRELLPILDNLERAIAHAREVGDIGVLREGVQLTHTQLLNNLRRVGVARIEVSSGTPFDPTLHEAMMQEETGEVPPNTVVRELQPGYLNGERLLRATLVTVARAPSWPEASGPTPSGAAGDAVHPVSEIPAVSAPASGSSAPADSSPDSASAHEQSAIPPAAQTTDAPEAADV